ncbi:tail assembly chaperone [Arthrobacter phage Adumb2043]|uniref:Tail assembly chaperone n=1 Tax=Arthrobacter phage Adumb2043 TaxID=2776851 RepID=A0A7M1CKU6_9CAUD|nr:tail assembly chaperone [Arthrobacter phage Adumb2043]QOP65075.1 tail assembly chaperone [Arthrobacter phage Adumb2043]
MTSRKTPAAAEALGESIPFSFEGKDFMVLPSSEWSFDAIEAYEQGRVLAFLSEILDADSFKELRAMKPKASVLGEFVVALQKAAGIAGKLASLAALLREAPDVVEADLQHFYGVDLADYWRGGLSPRRLSVLIEQLPPTSATARHYAKNDGWDLHAFLLSDLFHAFTGEVHPSRPKPQGASRYSELRARLEAQKARLHAPKEAAQ